MDLTTLRACPEYTPPPAWGGHQAREREPIRKLPPMPTTGVVAEAADNDADAAPSGGGGGAFAFGEDALKLMQERKERSGGEATLAPHRKRRSIGQT